MKAFENIGLSNIVPEKTQILHSTLVGRKTFGRVADLLCAWTHEMHHLPESFLGNLRILISGLLESLPSGGQSSTKIEMTVFDSQIVVAIRSDCTIEVDPFNPERSFTQHWLNSEATQVLRKVILPQDRIEVRYQGKTNLVEWRVHRNLLPTEVDLGVSSFLVVGDQRDSLDASEGNYTDLGELPYQEWLESVYRSSRKEADSGEIRVKGYSTQGDSDLARIKVGEELGEITERIRISSRDEESQSSESNSSADSGKEYDQIIRRVRKQEILENELTAAIESLKRENEKTRSELKQQKKIHHQVVDLLNKKEMELYRMERQLKESIPSAPAEAKSGSTQGGDNPFRVKALEMYEKLQDVVRANAELEKTVRELRARGGGFSEFSAEASELNGIRHNQEDLEKKAERLQRALETEKSKTKGLLDRALVAEKEAQSAAPIISDLESKVEHTLKTGLQHKKDLDAVKQKLVQAEAEKNKIKNELVKAEALIQTLNKRLAG